MSMIRWYPWHELEQMNGHDMSVDVYEDNGNIIVRMHVAGINPDKVDIAVEDEYVVVSGTRDDSEEVQDEHYYRKEIRYGYFERRIPLPCAVDEEGTRADYKQGVLRILLPKKVTGKNRKKIKIEQNSEREKDTL